MIEDYLLSEEDDTLTPRVLLMLIMMDTWSQTNSKTERAGCDLLKGKSAYSIGGCECPGNA